jgi:hypothetical protein
MPTYQYRLNIRDPDNGNSHNVGMTDPLKQMRPFTVAGNGGCLEAQFSALTTGMDIKPRSIVTLETKTDAADWVPRYKGVAVVPGAARSFYPTSVKLAPMKKRFYEKIIPALKITGGDVAAMVRSVVSVAGNRPAGTVYNAAEIPDLSLTLGDRYTFGLESVGDFMDAMAAACPADGASPAVTWDTLADGTIFFKRVNTSRTYAIGTAGVKVKWKEIDAEDVCTRVTLLLADKPQPSSAISENIANAPNVPKKFIPVPFHYKYNSGNSNDAEKVIPVQISDGVLTKQTASVNTTYTYQVTDPADALDGSLTTYAEFVPVGGVSILMLEDISGHVFEATVTYESDAKEDELSLVISYVENGVFGGERSQCKLPLPPTTSGPSTVYLVGLVSTEHFDIYDASRISIVLGGDAAGTYNVIVHDVSVFKLNEPLAERIAKSHIRIPAQEAAEVIVPGIETPVTRVTLTGYGTYNVAAVEYGPGKDSADGGMQTIFKLEQADDPELTGQSSLIKQADSKATMQAIQFQRRG